MVLRLLEPEADLMSDKERHSKANYQKKLRPVAQVRQHLKRFIKGPSKVVIQRNEQHRKKLERSQKKRSTTTTTPTDVKETSTHDDSLLPAVDLVRFRKSVLILDQSSPMAVGQERNGWLAAWKNNFHALQIRNLRSPIHTHCDPYDHRSLEHYADDIVQASGELVAMPHLTQRDAQYRGPYQVPSNAIFLEFHDLLTKAYGIDDMVHSNTTVLSIRPCEPTPVDPEPCFEVDIEMTHSPEDNLSIAPAPTRTKVKTRRLVAALGPQFQFKHIPEWEQDLLERYNKRSSTTTTSKKTLVSIRRDTTFSRNSSLALETTKRS